MKESGLLSVLSRLMRSFNAKLQPRSHAVDIMQVRAARSAPGDHSLRSLASLVQVPLSAEEAGAVQAVEAA